MNKYFIKIYAEFLKKNLNPKKPLKVIFDCSNGTTGPIIKEIFKKKSISPANKIKIVLINEKPNGAFPAHGPNPLSKGATNDLIKKIKEEKADFGIIFDADGDRAFFLDNNGKQINSDTVARLLIWQLKSKKIIVDVRAGWLIKKIKNQKSKIKIYESRVGHYFIKNLMKKIKADFGAENSGHYYFSPSANFYFDSGILAAIHFINAASNIPYSLKNFINLLPRYYHSEEINFKINPKMKKIKIEAVKKYFIKQINKISELDGLTMEFNDWWFNLRASNTEPYIRLNVEATNKNILDESIKKIYALISS